MAFAWFAAFGLARLTGAVAVVIVLGTGVVAAVAALTTGWWRLRRVSVTVGVDRTQTTVGDPVTLTVRTARPIGGSVHVGVRRGTVLVAAGWLDGDTCVVVGQFGARALVDHLDIELDAAGTPGWCWWRRRCRTSLDRPLVVAPRSAGPGSRVDVHAATDAGLDAAARRRATDGELDGIRPWRDGDGDQAVHWPTSLRVGALVVHDRQPADCGSWVVHVDPDADDPDAETGRARWAATEGLRQGVRVLGAVGAGTAVDLVDDAAVCRWTATCLPQADVARAERSWWRHVEPTDRMSGRARWAVAAAAAVAMAMLTTALAMPPISLASIIAGCVAGAAVTVGDVQQRRWVRGGVQTVVAVIAVAGMVAILRGVGDIDGLLSVIRGPLPEMLMLLVVLHGFECTTRRAARASLAFTAVVAVQAASLRVDRSLGLWLAVWGVVWAFAFAQVGARPDQSVRRATPADRTRRVGGMAVSMCAVGTATVAALSLVQVPDGPANLGLPASFDTDVLVDRPGSLADVDGSETTAGTTSDSRAATSGGYPGFDQSLDTSMRGDLGDEVVMSVRAPEPDFWRGQTFGTFDGRFWYADDDPGVVSPGPDVFVQPTVGDVPNGGVATEEFVQTYYLQVDHPNVVFAAYRPTRVVIDGALWARPDGALRSGQVMTEGAVYTVVSERPQVTVQALRGAGHVADSVGPIGRQQLAAYLEVPASTTARTRALANDVAGPTTSTYDTILAMQAWLGTHVEYDLDAPVPADGADAVDDFLFRSQRGFCEQIATALTVMLRTRGVPARLATGYVPGERDRVSGVWTVRARDAHAWVEVWFPGIGWQAFDPTASVPLAGEHDRASVGGDLLRAARDVVATHGRQIVAATATAIVTLLFVAWAVRRIRTIRYRRRRGRWGLLQDRLYRASIAHGIDTTCSNPELARRWAVVEPTVAPAVDALADLLDRVAFDPCWNDDDRLYAEADALVTRVH